MTKIEHLKAAYEALTEDALEEDDPAYVSSEGLEARAEFITLAHNMVPQLLKAMALIEIISRMVTDGEIQDQTDGDECMGGDDAAETLSNLIESAREIKGELK